MSKACAEMILLHNDNLVAGARIMTPLSPSSFLSPSSLSPPFIAVEKHHNLLMDGEMHLIDLRRWKIIRWPGARDAEGEGEWGDGFGGNSCGNWFNILIPNGACRASARCEHYLLISSHDFWLFSNVLGYFYAPRSSAYPCKRISSEFRQNNRK